MNFYYMLNKLFKGILIVFVCFFNTSSSTIDAITIKGEIEIRDIQEDLLIFLNVEKSVINEMIVVDIKVNNETILDKEEYITHYLKKNPITIKGFNTNNETKEIYINIRYRDLKAPSSVITFKINAPTYDEYILESLDKSKCINKNPISVSFYMYKDSPTINYQYESVDFNGKSIILINGKRIVDFSDFIFYIDSKKEYELDYIELRLYHHFVDSDLLYKNDLYTVFELPIVQKSEGYYQLSSDINYYISEIDGNIYLYSNEYTNEDLLPFFIPFSINDENEIKYELVLYDIGINHTTYIYQGYIITNNLDNDYFKYTEIKDVFNDVVYE